MEKTFCEKYLTERKKIKDIADSTTDWTLKITMKIIILGLDDCYFHKKNNENLLAVTPK